ncbi:MAG: acylneuraminate cytidylyltransferase family protein [Putridiphycobacter sp.]
MKVLAIIPARGGSKGLPKKNIKPLGDKPLIAYSIESAKSANLITKTIVSSDNQDIINIAKAFKAEVPFVRPKELAEDNSTTVEVLLHAINFFESKGETFDYIVLLQPTTPFRKNGDIDKMIELAKSSDADLVVSVKETSANPYYVLFEENKAGYLEKSKPSNFTRRQDCPVVYEYNGSIYIIKVSSLQNQKSLAFEKTKKFVMDDYFSIDIDSQFDFDFAEFMLTKIIT